jgi:hypothetical protein
MTPPRQEEWRALDAPLQWRPEAELAHLPEGERCRLTLFRASCERVFAHLNEVCAGQYPDLYHFRRAKAALVAEGVLNADQEESAEDKEKIAILAAALYSHLRELAQALPLADPVDRLGPPVLEDGLLWLDARAARHLEEKLGAKKEARDLRENALHRREEFFQHLEPVLAGIAPYAPLEAFEGLFRLWGPVGAAADEPIPFALPLAILLWRKKVKARAEGRRERQTAISSLIAREVERVCWETGRVVRPAAGGAELVSDRGEVLATIPTLPPEEFEVMQRAVRQLGSLTGHRIIRWLAGEGHQRVLDGEPNPSIITVYGGMEAFAEKIGANSRKAPEEALAVLRAGQEFRVTWPGGEVGGLWMYTAFDRTTRGKRAWLEIRLGSILLPFYAKRNLPKHQQWLVPIVPLPPFVGRPHDFAAQAAFQFKIVGALLDHRIQLVTDGGALLGAEELRRRAEQVGLPVATIPRVLDRWSQDGDDGPAFLERVERDRYNLADTAPYRGARGFLIEAGRRTLEGQAGARATVEKKARRLKAR